MMAGILSGPKALEDFSIFITAFSSLTVNSDVLMFKMSEIFTFGRVLLLGSLPRRFLK